MTTILGCIEIEIFILSLKAKMDRGYFYLFVHSLLYFECLFWFFMLCQLPTSTFGTRKWVKDVVKY